MNERMAQLDAVGEACRTLMAKHKLMTDECREEQTVKVIRQGACQHALPSGLR